MRRRLSITTVLAIALVGFSAPAMSAYALWSSAASATLSVSTASGVPNPPTIDCTSATPSGQRTLTWQPVTGATGYRVFRSTTTNADASYTQVGIDQTATTYSAGVNGNQTHYYRVMAINTAGVSAFSNTLKLIRGTGPAVSCGAP